MILLTLRVRIYNRSGDQKSADFTRNQRVFCTFLRTSFLLTHFLTHFLPKLYLNCTQENGHDGFDPRPRLVDTHLTHRVRGTSSVIK